MSELEKDSKVTKDSDKYKVALKLVNKILINLGKDEIDDLTNFKDIDREDIIKDVNKQALDGLAKEIFKHYDKKKCGYYRKTDALVLNVLRGMMKDTGFKLSKKQEDKHKVIDGQNFRKTYMLYSINLNAV